MIDLPVGAFRSVLNSQLSRGKVLLTQIVFPEGPLFKRMILLNNNFSEEDIYYLLTTSRVGFYVKYGNREPQKGNYIYIIKGGTPINSNEPMIIDCREVYDIKKEKLVENYKSKMLRYLGDMPEEIMTKIDKIISASRLISQKIKIHIIPNHT